MEEKERKGYRWVKCGDSGGFWVKEDSVARHTHKLPFFCPYEKCRRITGTLDDKYMLEYGVCMNCYNLYIQGRKKPLIDIEYYKKRLKERGY